MCPGPSLDVIGGILIDAERGEVHQGVGPGGPPEDAGAERPGRQLRDEARCARSTRSAADQPGQLAGPVEVHGARGARLTAQVDAAGQGHEDQEEHFLTALEAPQNLGLPKYAKNHAEGFLFPDTYDLTAESTATTTMQQMVGQYKTVASDIQLEASAKKLKRSRTRC